MKTQRQSARLARRNLSVAQRANASEIICKRVIASREFFSSACIGCYLPMHDEVDTREIIERAWRAKKRIFAPVIDLRGNMIFRRLLPDTEICRNKFGIWEPLSGEVIDTKSLDAVVTPLVAFDERRHRIGMGGGYFDRCFHFLRLRKKWLRPKLIGVAFDCQKVGVIAPNPWDIRLCRVFTEV